MFLQNFVKLRAVVHELCWVQRKKNLDENNTILSVATARTRLLSCAHHPANRLTSVIRHKKYFLTHKRKKHNINRANYKFFFFLEMLLLHILHIRLELCNLQLQTMTNLTTCYACFTLHKVYCTGHCEIQYCINNSSKTQNYQKCVKTTSLANRKIHLLQVTQKRLIT